MPELTDAQMYPARVPAKRPARATILRTVGLAVVAALGVAGATVPAQAATPSPDAQPATVTAAVVTKPIVLKAGPHRAKAGFRTETLGATQAPDGTWGFCIDDGKQNPDGRRWVTEAIANMKPGPRRTQLQWIVSAYPKAIGTAIVEPAVRATLLRVMSGEGGAFESDWDKSYVGQLRARSLVSVVDQSDQMLGDAKRNAGTVSLQGGFISKPGPDTRKPGVVTLTALGNGHTYPGQPITWDVTGADISSAATKTGKDGQARLRFIPTGAGPVRVSAELVTPEWRFAEVLMPSSDRKQRLIRVPDRHTAKTSWAGSYDARFKATVTQECGSECKGRPPVTFTAKAGQNPVRWQAVLGSKVLASMTLKAGESGSRTFTGTDGTSPALRYSVKVRGKWSPWRTSQTVDVVCPAWPGIQPVMVCECDGTTTGGYTFTGPGGKWFYVVRVTRGSVVEEKAIVGTETVTLTGPIASGDHMFAEFDAYADAAHTKRVGGGKWHGYTSD